MIKLIQQIYGIYPNPHSGFYWRTQKELAFYIFTYRLKLLGAMPQASSAIYRNKATFF